MNIDEQPDLIHKSRVPWGLKRRLSPGLATVVCGMILLALSSCGTKDKLDTANTWSLTEPDAVVGGISLNPMNGATWGEAGLQLDGSSYAASPEPGPISTDASFTVSAWARPEGQPEQYDTVLSQAGEVAGAFFLGLSEGFWSFSVKPADGNGEGFETKRDRATKVDIRPGDWIQLTGVYDAELGRASLYINGYPTSTNGVFTAPVFAAAGPLTIGAAQARGELTDFFSGTIADVRTWSRALNAEEVMEAAQTDPPEGAVLAEPEKSTQMSCPNAYGGVCLGDLEAGRYTTTAFKPALTYTVPDGWRNAEDLPGNFMVHRAEDSQSDEFTGGSYVGVWQNIEAASMCLEEAEPGVGASARELADWYRSIPDLEIVSDEQVSVGGLDGIALDFRMDKNWESECPIEGVYHAIPLIIGGGVSDLHHVMSADLEMRLVLLDWNEGNVVIEVTAAGTQHTLDEFLDEQGAQAIVDSFVFDTVNR